MEPARPRAGCDRGRDQGVPAPTSTRIQVFAMRAVHDFEPEGKKFIFFEMSGLKIFRKG
jgi:hypothetical protein